MWTMMRQSTLALLLTGLYSSHVLASLIGGSPRVGSMEPNVGTAGNVGGSVVTVFLEHDPLALTEFPPEDLTRISEKEDRPGLGVFQVSRARVPALCKFDEEEVEGIYTPGMAGHSRVTCRTPPLDVGTSEVRVSLDGKDFSSNFVKYTVLFTSEAMDPFAEGESNVRRSLNDIVSNALAPGPSLGHDNFYGFYGLSPGEAPGQWEEEEWPEMGPGPAPGPSMGGERVKFLEQAQLRSDINPDDLEDAFRKPHGSGRVARSDLEEFETCVFAVAGGGGGKVILGLAGSIPVGFQEFYCRFGSKVVAAEKVIPPGSLNGPMIITCKAPAPSDNGEGDLITVQVSTDSMAWTPGGPLLQYSGDDLVAVIEGDVESKQGRKFHYLPYSTDNCILSTVTKDGNLAELSSLVVGGAVLDPSFDPSVHYYTAEILASPDGGIADITADVVRGSGASLSINGELRGFDPSPTIQLSPGTHVIPISVTSRNGRVTSIYTLKLKVVPAQPFAAFTAVSGSMPSDTTEAAEHDLAAARTGGMDSKESLVEGEDSEEEDKAWASGQVAPGQARILQGEPDDLVHQDFAVTLRSGDLKAATDFVVAFSHTFGGSSHPPTEASGTIPGPCDVNEDFADLNEAVILGTLQLQSDIEDSSPSGLQRTACALQVASRDSSELTHVALDALRAFLHSRIRASLRPPQPTGLDPRTAKCMLGLVGNLMRAAESDRQCEATTRSVSRRITALDPMSDLMHIPSSIARAVLLRPTHMAASTEGTEAVRLLFNDPNLSLLAAQVVKGMEDEEMGFVGRAGPVTCAMQVTDERVAVGQKVHIITYAFSGLNPLPRDVARSMKGEQVVVVAVESESGVSLNADVLVRTTSQLLQPRPQFQGLRIWSQDGAGSGQGILALLSSPGKRITVSGAFGAATNWLFSSAVERHSSHRTRTRRVFITYSPTSILIALQYAGLFLCIACIAAWGCHAPPLEEPTCPEANNTYGVAPPQAPPPRSLWLAPQDQSGRPPLASRSPPGPPTSNYFPLPAADPFLPSPPNKPHPTDEESGLASRIGSVTVLVPSENI